MEVKIKEYLVKLEQQKNIKILLACETGSRAWGFPSPDSDYDVRIIYMHQNDWYLSINEPKDYIELMLDNNEIDISGWELRKSLRLLWKSNASMLERIQSPILYQADQKFLEGIGEIAASTFSRIATMHHYLSMAKKTYAEILDQEQYKLKKFFYALRAAVACKWILEKETIPPIVFTKMLEGLEVFQPMKERIDELISLKATKSEGYFHTGELLLKQFIAECIEKADHESNKLPSGKGEMEQLNSFFKEMLQNQ
jgi:uncharacterized protein